MFCMFIVVCSWHLVDGLITVSVVEGDSFTLHVINRYIDYIQWRFGPENTFIVIQFKKEGSPDVSYFNYERFKGRLQIDNQTGSLTIRNSRISDSGLYELMMSHAMLLFNVSVYARLPAPIITRDALNSSSSSSSSSSVSNCSLLCSVVNVSHVTLSWYKGNSSLSSISVSDVISSVSLHLEVEYQDTNTYSCVLNNPISHHTTHLDTSRVCQTCPDCGFTEAVIRLVLSAVVGVAIVAIVIYDITSRRAEEKRRKSESVHEMALKQS